MGEYEEALLQGFLEEVAFDIGTAPRRCDVWSDSEETLRYSNTRVQNTLRKQGDTKTGV